MWEPEYKVYIIFLMKKVQQLCNVNDNYFLLSGPSAVDARVDFAQQLSDIMNTFQRVFRFVDNSTMR